MANAFYAYHTDMDGVFLCDGLCILDALKNYDYERMDNVKIDNANGKIISGLGNYSINYVKPILKSTMEDQVKKYLNLDNV
jgi:hypothetical protein